MFLANFSCFTRVLKGRHFQWRYAWIWFGKCVWTLWCPSAGAGLQHTTAKGFPERSDALGDAISGRFLLTLAGARPEDKDRERVQVSLREDFKPFHNHEYSSYSSCASPLPQSLRLSLHATPVWAGGWRGWDFCRRRPEGGLVSTTGPHQNRSHVPCQKKGGVDALSVIQWHQFFHNWFTFFSFLQICVFLQCLPIYLLLFSGLNFFTVFFCIYTFFLTSLNIFH